MKQSKIDDWTGLEQLLDAANDEALLFNSCHKKKIPTGNLVANGKAWVSGGTTIPIVQRETLNVDPPSTLSAGDVHLLCSTSPNFNPLPLNSATAMGT